MGNDTHNVIFILEEPALNYWAVCVIKYEGRASFSADSQTNMKVSGIAT